MPIGVICPHCSGNHALADDAAGRVINCPLCSELLTVPGISERLLGESPPPLPRKAVIAFVVGSVALLTLATSLEIGLRSRSRKNENRSMALEQKQLPNEIEVTQNEPKVSESEPKPKEQSPPIGKQHDKGDQSSLNETNNDIPPQKMETVVAIPRPTLRPASFRIGQRGNLAQPNDKDDYHVAEILSDGEFLIMATRLATPRFMLPPIYFIIRDGSITGLKRGQLYYSSDYLEVFETRRVNFGTVFVLRKVDTENPAIKPIEVAEWLNARHFKIGQRGKPISSHSIDGSQLDHWLEVDEILSEKEVLIRECFSRRNSLVTPVKFVVQMSTQGLADNARIELTEIMDIVDTKKVDRRTYFVLRPLSKKAENER